MDRKVFVQIAGGLPKSPAARNYRARRYQQKYFWKFFAASKWRKSVKAIYSEFTVDTLLRKNNYSIEHIVPKSILRTELDVAHPLVGLRFNATINPFNYAVSHRKVNACRSSLQFDLDDEPILSYRQKSVAQNIGTDHEGEWVVPKRSQSIVARAIVYMGVMYGLTSFGRNNIEEYIPWLYVAKPHVWEKEYNRWIKKKYSISNPLIEISNRYNPDLFFADSELLDSTRAYLKAGL